MNAKNKTFVKLEREALASASARARRNYHPSESFPLQVMHVCLEGSTLIFPHIHEKKRMEFYYALRGQAYFVEFHVRKPVVKNIIMLSASDGRHYYNQSTRNPHLLIPKTRFFHFVEVSNGSFRATPSQPRWFLEMTEQVRKEFWSDLKKFVSGVT